MKKLIFTLIMVSIIPVFANQAQVPYSEGLHYTSLDPIFDTESKEQVIIYEFFGYKCPHCATFQAFSEPWKQKLPKHVKLVRVPVVFQPGWEILAKAYYTAESMGIIDQTHQAMFNAIHKQRKRFGSIEDIANWYAENFQIDRDSFISKAGSFMIDSKVRQSNNMMRKMKITSTPSIIINGKFIPNKKSLRTNNALLEMAAFLADKEAASMGIVK